jgi:hypothetical protein
MANEERLAQLQAALDELVEPVPISDKEVELRSEDSLNTAQESFNRAQASYIESVARLEGKIAAEKAIEDLPLPDDSVEEESEEETEEEE